jgi:hypothetical protein
MNRRHFLRNGLWITGLLAFLAIVRSETSMLRRVDGLAGLNKPVAAAGGKSLAQSASNSVANSATIVKAFGGDVTSGNIVVVAVYGAANASSVPNATHFAKSAGTATIGTITLNATNCNGILRSIIVSAPVTGSGSLTITYTDPDNGFYGSMGIFELSGFTGIDGTGVFGSGASGAPTTSSFNTAEAGFIVGAVATDTGSAATHTKGEDYTQLVETEDGTSTCTGMIQYRVTTGALTGETTDWVAPTTIPWYCCAAAYK